MRYAVGQVGYERLVLAAPANVTPAGGSSAAALRRDVVVLPAAQFQQLSQNSTVARAYAPAQLSYLAPDAVYWQEDAYGLVRAVARTRYAAASYANEAQTTAALQAAEQADSHLHGELLVLPAYQGCC